MSLGKKSYLEVKVVAVMPPRTLKRGVLPEVKSRNPKVPFSAFLRLVKIIEFKNITPLRNPEVHYSFQQLKLKVLRLHRKPDFTACNLSY